MTRFNVIYLVLFVIIIAIVIMIIILSIDNTAKKNDMTVVKAEIQELYNMVNYILDNPSEGNGGCEECGNPYPPGDFNENPVFKTVRSDKLYAKP